MQAKSPPNVVCKFYDAGYCKNGWACQFIHETSRNDHTKNEPDGDVTVAPEPCRYFIKGRCLKGDRCNFSHDEKLHITHKDEDTKGTETKSVLPCWHDDNTTNNNNVESTSSTNAEIENKESSEEKDPDLEHSTAQLDLECSICLESVLKQHKQFGLLPRCKHVFCIDCIRSWRQPSNAIEGNKKVHHVCPVCQVKNFYVVPSAIYETGQNKKLIIYEYRQKLKSIPCKYYKLGRNACPFADRCFYLHGNIQRNASAANCTRLIINNNNVTSGAEDIASEKVQNTRHMTGAHSPGEFKYERIRTLARAIQYARALRQGNAEQYGEYEQDYLRARENEELNLELAAIVAEDGNGAVGVPSRIEEKMDRDEERSLEGVVHQDSETDSVAEDEFCYETRWE